MNRRQFIQTATVGSMGILPMLSAAQPKNEGAAGHEALQVRWNQSVTPNLKGHVKICEFEDSGVLCQVYEDLRSRDGVITIVSRNGAKLFTTMTEEVFSTADRPFFGMNLEALSKSKDDLLALHILHEGGDPDPQLVKDAIPPLIGCTVGKVPNTWDIWNTIIGTKECQDAMPIYPGGNTRNYFPVQRHPGFEKVNVEHRWEGMLNGWLPAVRKVFPLPGGGYYEVLVFADVDSRKPHITDTWHRTTLIRDGRLLERTYGFSYPEFPPLRESPRAEDFYRALLRMSSYWEQLLKDVSEADIPEQWHALSKHAFVKELITRPGGVYPRYGAVDEDYASPVYDGFQDTFTTSLYANLEWGRIDAARAVFDNYYAEFTNRQGVIDMRGPEIGQYGLTLSLIARLFEYTGDEDLIERHREKIEATAQLLVTLHDESLKLAPTAPGYGLIHGWSESDSCLSEDPKAYWQPYYSNSALAARGLLDLSTVWKKMSLSETTETADRWQKRARALRERTIESMRANLQSDMTPPYVGPLPGTKTTFQEAQYSDKPNIQQWSHRIYSELLQADILPPELANLTIDCLKSNGGTTAGVVADIWPVLPEGRKILGFISYGYAQMLLRLDRIEEFLLFMYSHRYHEHTRGSWTAMETRHIGAATNLFCMPAQQSLPLLVRWMLVLEDSDSDVLHIAKGVPRTWLEPGGVIGIDNAATRFGRVSFKMRSSTSEFISSVDLERPRLPREVHVKIRLPNDLQVKDLLLNGKPAAFSGQYGEAVVIRPDGETHFEISGQLMSH